jgi:hypothetical protein
MRVHILLYASVGFAAVIEGLFVARDKLAMQHRAEATSPDPDYSCSGVSQPVHGGVSLSLLTMGKEVQESDQRVSHELWRSLQMRSRLSCECGYSPLRPKSSE